MKKIYFSLFSLFLLILIGGGCEKATIDDQNNEENANSKSAFEDIVDITENELQEVKGIEARAEVNTDGTVDVYWDVETDLEKKAESYRLIYDRTEKPTHPGYMWFERGSAHRNKYWTGLPAGEGHIRVCAVKDTKCFEYSNDVKVTIPEVK